MTKYTVPLAHVVIATECSIVDYAVNSKIFVYVMAWIAVVVDWTSRVMQPEQQFPPNLADTCRPLSEIECPPSLHELTT